MNQIIAGIPEMPIWSVVVLVVLGFLLVSILFQWLWNSTLIELFDFKRIRFWQSFRILIMALILTGGGTSLIHYKVTKTTETRSMNGVQNETEEWGIGLP